MKITKCGNYYTDQEWAEMMANWNHEIAETDEYLDKIEVIIRKGAQMIERIIGEENAHSISRHLFNNGIEGIQFSSEEKREAIEAISDWMASEERKIR